MIPVLILVLACCYSCIAEVIPITQAHKDEILNAHNEWRKNSQATYMRRLIWNDELAKVAERSAAKCDYEHSAREMRTNVAGFDRIGENIAVDTSKTTFKNNINDWGSEIKDYDLASGQCSAVCTHYTQMVWSKTSDVGCAMAHCAKVTKFANDEWGGYLTFCNYGTAGNMNGEKPFEKGSAGSKCQQIFKVAAGADGLCGEGGSTGDDKTPPDDNGKPKPKPDEGDQPKPKPNEGNGDTAGGDCVDEISYCNDWKFQCGKGFTKQACRKTCNLCGDTSTDTGNDEDESASKECKDEMPHCNDWLQACGKEEWTHRGCRKSCKYC